MGKRNSTPEKDLMAELARKLQEEASACGGDDNYGRCLEKAAHQLFGKCYRAALADAKNRAELVALLEHLDAFTDQLATTAVAYLHVAQKAHTDTASVMATSEAVLQYAVQRRDVVGPAEEAWRFALAHFPEVSDP